MFIHLRRFFMNMFSTDSGKILSTPQRLDYPIGPISPDFLEAVLENPGPILLKAQNLRCGGSAKDLQLAVRGGRLSHQADRLKVELTLKAKGWDWDGWKWGYFFLDL